jgi:multidrug efflux pump subunit AcrA (membrane-fusion protein)
VPVGTTRQARQARDSLSGIVERFRSTIPNGVMFDPTARSDSRIDTFSSAQRRELFYGAVAYTRKMFERYRNRYFDVTALIADGKLRLIFGVPIDQDRKVRSHWRSYMNTTNVAVAFGAQIAEESKSMFPLVYRRTLYVAVAIAVVTGLYFIPINHSVTGFVHLRPTKRAEIRAPVAGFPEQMNVEQGTQVVSGGVIARLEVPDLKSQIAGQHARIESMQAKLRLLQAGPRPERVAAQREIVGLTEAWRNQAQHELQQAIEKDVQRIAMKINEYRASMKLAREEFELSKRLIQAKTLHTRELRRAETEQQVWESQYQQAVAEQEANASMVVLRAVSEIVSASRTLLKHTPH